MDLISSNIGNGDGEIPLSNPIYTDFDQKRQTSDHGESIHLQILPGVSKVHVASCWRKSLATWLICLACFTDGVFSIEHPWTGLTYFDNSAVCTQNFLTALFCRLISMHFLGLKGLTFN